MEYKSTLRWDIRQESKKSGIPEAAVVRTIAGFLNSEYGGTLLIGVADDGTIHGLEDDYRTFSRRGERGDRDLLSQQLQNLITGRLGDAAATLVNWEFHRIDGHDLCRVSVESSGFPVFEKKGDEKKFWWRLQTGTRDISNPDERQRVMSSRRVQP
jgi:type I restriction enzyme R subunit